MGKAKEIVKLRFKKLKNGEKSAYFDIYRNGVREYLWQEERLVPELDEVTKENNQKLMLLFEERRRSLIAELTIDKSGIANRAFNTDITLLQWLDIYEIELLQRASRSYMRGYSKLKDYLTGFNADILLKDVNEDFVVSFFEYLKKQPCTNHNEKCLSFESCWDMLKKLGNSMNGAIRERHIDANPCHSLLAVCLKKKKKRPLVCLSQEELLRLIDTPYRQEYVKRQFLFACFTGSTPKTIERLCWKHIYRKDGRTWAILWQSRSKRDIEVPLSDMAVACLPPRRRAKGSCHVFECRRHAIMAIHHENWRKEAGIETPVNYIVAKNTYASLLLGAGADYYTAAYMMGFCTTDYMEEYEGYLNRKKYDSVEKMDSIFSGIANLLAKEPINKENENLE